MVVAVAAAAVGRRGCQPNAGERSASVVQVAAVLSLALISAAVCAASGAISGALDVVDGFGSSCSIPIFCWSWSGSRDSDVALAPERWD